MRCIPACVGLALFLTYAHCSSGEVFAQGNEGSRAVEETARHWRQSAEFKQLWLHQQRSNDPEEQITLIKQALKVEPDIRYWVLHLPRDEARAQLWWRLGVAYDQRKGGDKAENFEHAIAAYAQALQYYTREKAAADWASLQTNVGLSYLHRIGGEPKDNLEKAIVHLEAALPVRSRQATPQQWGGLHNELGRAYQNRIDGERADNIEKAIAHFELSLTASLEPSKRALAQLNLAGTYVSRVRGDRSNNQEKAISACEAALSSLTRENSPTHWAETQSKLAAIYADRRLGDRADNVEIALGHYEAALSVHTRAAWPTKWADTKFALGMVYLQRVYGVAVDNIENAIDALEASLSVYKREASPNDWANVQTILAATYVGRIRGDRADNIEKAIAGHEAALTVYGESAAVQNNLGVAYRRRVRGDPADNLEKAIAAFEAAAAIAKREPASNVLTATQRNLGRAYLVRLRGDRADNMQRAIAHLDASLARIGAQTLRPDEYVFARDLGEALVEVGSGIGRATPTHVPVRIFCCCSVRGLTTPRPRACLPGRTIFLVRQRLLRPNGETPQLLFRSPARAGLNRWPLHCDCERLLIQPTKADVSRNCGTASVPNSASWRRHTGRSVPRRSRDWSVSDNSYCSWSRSPPAPMRTRVVRWPRRGQWQRQMASSWCRSSRSSAVRS